MKLRLPRLTPASRIALGLVALMVTLLLLIDLALKLVPDQVDIQRTIRESTSERLAVQATSLIQVQAWDTLKRTLNESVLRDRSILSLAVRQQNGKLVIMVGEHLRHWQPLKDGHSTLTHVSVPIYAKQAHWGSMEISYTPVTPQTLGAWLSTPLIALVLVIAPVGFLAFYLYMRRTLQYLDPTSAIPDRVRVAFDALSEGVTVIDRSGRIMLFNKAFQQLHPHVESELLGKSLSGLTWLMGDHVQASLPWALALQSQSAVSGQMFSILQPDQSVVRVIVNAAPIQDAQGKLRGCMVTYHDITQLHQANETMRHALDALEASREQIEQQNIALTRLATRDSLTDCLNRRAFFQETEPLFRKVRQEARNMAVIMADIDYFKRVNDTHGHLVGDQVIVAVAQSMKRHLREGDLLCRYGGEEFCVALPGASEEMALEVAERLRAEIELTVGVSIVSVSNLAISSSFGVATLKSGADSLPELIELADFALYHAKRGGRNRVSLWSLDMNNPDLTLAVNNDR
ncbi:MAG: diguanylate cyclase [Thiobacillus sp.]